MRPLRLQHRIILSVTLGLSVVMLIFGYGAMWALDQSTQAAFRARLALAVTISSQLDAMIDHSIGILEKTAALPEINNREGGLATARRVVEDTQARLGTFAVVTLLDSSGRLLTAAPELPEAAGTDMLYHAGARGVISTGKRHIAELPEGSHPHAPLACLAVPILGERGDLTGILMAELDPRDPSFHLTQSRPNSASAVVELVNQNRVVVNTVQSDGGLAMANHLPLLAEFVAAGRSGVSIHEVAGAESHVVAYAPLTKLPEWAVVVEQPEYAVLALPRELRNQMVIFGVIALLAAVAIAWVDVRRVVRPLGTLTKAAARIGEGDLATPVEIQRGDEVGTLARTLETMRQGLCNLIEAQKLHELELERRVQQRTEEVGVLLATSEAFASTLHLPKLMEIILSEAHRICPGIDAGMVAILDKRSGLLIPVASFGCKLSPLRQVRLKRGEGVVGKIFESGRPSFLTNEDLARQDGDIRASNLKHLKASCSQFGRARSALAVPLMAKEHTVGILIAYDFQGSLTLSEHDLKVLQAIASQAAVAVENAQLYEEVQQKEVLRGQLLAKVITAQEEERHRIARELHDESAQALTALMMALDAVDKVIVGIPDAQQDKLNRAKGLTQQALGDVRRIISDLRPTVLDDLGLASAVRWYAQHRLEGEEIRVQVSVSGLHERLPTNVETDLYRIVQEAITNIAKHANASNAWIKISRSGARLSISVEDDGRGFQVDDVGPVGAAGGAMGLLGMRERVDIMGGSLVIRSTSQQGTAVLIDVPLVQKEG